MSNEMQAMAARAATARAVAERQSVIGVPGQPDEKTRTETRTKNILGPVYFTLSNLDVRGLGNIPADLSNSQYIIAANEYFVCSVDVEFNKTPLSELLMCLGTEITVNFGFEGFGVDGDKISLSKKLISSKGVYKYTVKTDPVRPQDIRPGMSSGLYEIAAVATVGPVDNPCSTKIWGHGYIEEVNLQVYPAGEE